MRENKETLGACFDDQLLPPPDELSRDSSIPQCIGQLALDIEEWQPAKDEFPAPHFKEALFPPRERIRIPVGERIATPTDSRGLVDLAKLVTEVVACVDEGYLWRGKSDRHHLHWFNTIYKDANLFMQDETLGRTFRGLPIHIVWLPKELHAFIHAVTLPVEAPSEEVMRYRIESWRVAYQLFNATKAILNHRYLTNEQMARKVVRELIEDQFKRLELGIRSAEELPHEFRFFETHHAQKVLGAREVSHVRKRDLVNALKGLAAVKHSLSRDILSPETKDLVLM